MDDIQKMLENKRAAARLGGGAKRVEAQHKKGKLNIWDRPIGYRPKMFSFGLYPMGFLCLLCFISFGLSVCSFTLTSPSSSCFSQSR